MQLANEPNYSAFLKDILLILKQPKGLSLLDLNSGVTKASRSYQANGWNSEWRFKQSLIELQNEAIAGDGTSGVSLFNVYPLPLTDLVINNVFYWAKQSKKLLTNTNDEEELS